MIFWVLEFGGKITGKINWDGGIIRQFIWVTSQFVSIIESFNTNNTNTEKK